MQQQKFIAHSQKVEKLNSVFRTHMRLPLFGTSIIIGCFSFTIVWWFDEGERERVLEHQLRTSNIWQYNNNNVMMSIHFECARVCFWLVVCSMNNIPLNWINCVARHLYAGTWIGLFQAHTVSFFLFFCSVHLYNLFTKERKKTIEFDSNQSNMKITIIAPHSTFSYLIEFNFQL